MFQRVIRGRCGSLIARSGRYPHAVANRCCPVARTEVVMLRFAVPAVTSFLVSFAALAEESPLPQEWDYAAAMKAVAAKGLGRGGVVLHVGDSITYASPYAAWARAGEGRTEADREALKWMHAGQN